MRDWLALAESEVGPSERHQERVPKLTKSTKSPENNHFVDFGTNGTGSQDEAVALNERTAMALEGRVPTCYARAFAALQLNCPNGVDEARWQQVTADAAVFLDRWGRQAESLGWTAHDLIGPKFAPTALTWMLKGSSVIRLAQRRAYLSDGCTFTRVHLGRFHDPPQIMF